MDLSNEKLVEMIQSGIFPREHLEQLYIQNEPLIIKLIPSYLPNIDDLKQESYIVLCECAKKYDFKQGIKFNTYLGQAIMNMLSRYGYNNAPVKMSAQMLSLAHKYSKLIGQGLDDDIISIKLGVNKKQLEDIKKAYISKDLISLDTPIKNAAPDDNLTIADTIADDSAAFEDDIIERLDNSALWGVCKRRLSDIGYKVIYLHYKKGMPCTAIAKYLKMGYSTVIDIRRKSLRKLKGLEEVQAYNNYFYRHISLSQFRTTQTSTVENAVLKRLDILDKFGEKLLNELAQI